jgi:hypothetical protein
MLRLFIHFKALLETNVAFRLKSYGTAAPYIRADLSLASYGGYAWVGLSINNMSEDKNTSSI